MKSNIKILTKQNCNLIKIQSLSLKNFLNIKQNHIQIGLTYVSRALNISGITSSRSSLHEWKLRSGSTIFAWRETHSGAENHIFTENISSGIKCRSFQSYFCCIHLERFHLIFGCSIRLSPLGFPTVYERSQKTTPLEQNPSFETNCLEMKKYNSLPKRHLKSHCSVLLKQFQDFISGIAVSMSEEADKVLHQQSRKHWINIAVHLIQRTAEKKK